MASNSNSSNLINDFKISIPYFDKHQEETSRVFERQSRTPGFKQDALNKKILLVGAGGLGSWIGMGLIRSGAKYLTICDHDEVSITNLTRQFFTLPQVVKRTKKGIGLAENLSPFATTDCNIRGIGLPFEDALVHCDFDCDLIIIGVDNNPTRIEAIHFARKRHIPAIFAALSNNGCKSVVMLQGPNSNDACYHCAFPQLDPELHYPCVASIISVCYLAASFSVFFAHRALMGWPEGVKPYNWRMIDMLGQIPDQIGRIEKRKNCPTCGSL